jgi:hypothetical protein
MTNAVSIVVTNKLFITAAYKYVAMTIMMAQANLFVTKVDLPLDHPIIQKEVILSKSSVTPPRLMEFGGSVVTEKYLFGFGHGHLANFWQWEYHGGAGQNLKQRNEQWSKMTSQIGTNEVRELALDWLTSLGVDVATLEKKYPCKITQRFFYQSSHGQLQNQSTNIVLLPVFQIQWGSIPLRGHPQYSFPAATMTIFGPTKELIEYHLFDDALMLRPKLEITGAEKLLAIPDETFRQFDETQKNNLLEQFAR